MAESIKVLGQLEAPATSLTALYTVPGATSAVASTLVICNRTTSNLTFRVSVAVAGAVDDPSQYIFYDKIVPKNSSIFATVGLTLGAADVVRAYASATGLSFSLFGTEIS